MPVTGSCFFPAQDKESARSGFASDTFADLGR